MAVRTSASGAVQQGLQPTLKAARFWAHVGCVGLGAAEAVVRPLRLNAHRHGLGL
jgi:hypothetical protein